MDKDKGKMSVTGCMKYTLRILWNADKTMVWYHFFKQIMELIVESFLCVYLMQKMFFYIEGGGTFKELVVLVVIIASSHIALHFVSAHSAYYRLRKTPKVYRYIYEKIIDKATDIDLVRYEQPDFYDKFSKTLDECLRKSIDGMLCLTYAAGAIAGIITTGIMISNVDPVLMIFIVAPVTGSFVFGFLINKYNLRLRDEETKYKRVTEYIKRVFFEKKYASEIRLYNIKNLFYQKQEENFREGYEINKKYRTKIGFCSAMSMAVFSLLSGICSYSYVAYRVKVTGVESVGAYVAIVTTIGFVAWNLKRMVEQFVEAGNCCVYMQNLKDFLEYDSGKTGIGTIIAEEELGDIHFDNVCFRYEGSEHNVINNLSLSVKKGEKIALVGENGAGKTTLIKLLMGLYPVTEGQITVGGVNVNEFESQSYHEHIGTVFQDLQIFSLPLAENVLMKTPENDEERKLAQDSLIKAQFGDKLATLERGIDTMVSKEFDDDGFVCSGGQAQKIAIARVFAKNPDLVILDEPSSALDPIAEFNMYDNMMKASENKTVFFISHRLSSARIADKIYFLENGSIVESGTHDELMSKEGKYYEMFNSQAQNYRDNILHNLGINRWEVQS